MTTEASRSRFTTPVTLQGLALDAVLSISRWCDTREVYERLLDTLPSDLDYIGPAVSSTTVSVALQRLNRKGLIGKGPHPENHRLVRWHPDPSVEYPSCVSCGREFP